MFEPMLEADPALVATWLAFQNEWQAEGELPMYILLSDVARHLVSRLEEHETSRLEAIFKVVERWNIEGDNFVREAATVGLLEDLQNENLHRQTKPSDFEPWLLPETKRYWEEVGVFWSKGVVVSD
jgi:hypothetical protein